MTIGGTPLEIPTLPEMLRIKGVLILKRNATRDYLDFVALAGGMEDPKLACALEPMDRLYPQPNGESALQQLQIQLATPRPYDLEEVSLSEYKDLEPRWQDWGNVEAACEEVAIKIADIGRGNDRSMRP